MMRSLSNESTQIAEVQYGIFRQDSTLNSTQDQNELQILVDSTNNISVRQQNAASINPEQALIHMIKVMMGTGMLSLPLAFKYSGLYLGLILLVIICSICTYCCRMLVHASQFLCKKDGKTAMDYANVMKNAVENGPMCIRKYGYFSKQLVNVNIFISQLSFCCIYFVFMADNLKQFFDETSEIKISQAGWIAFLLIPILALCTIRQLKALAPLALIANGVYIIAVGIVIEFLVTNLNPINEIKKIGSIIDLPLFFGTVIFAFEGIAVVLPIENQMDKPQYFISKNGVLNTSSILVLAVYCTIGFYGYLALGDSVKDTVTLNLPPTIFYQTIKIMFVGCIIVSFPLQFYVPMERIEKWVLRKICPEKQYFFIYLIKYTLIVASCMGAELVPHLALITSLVGAFSGSLMALIFPPIIDLLCKYSQNELNLYVWTKNIFLLLFGLLGFATGTYSSLLKIAAAMSNENI